MLTFEKIRKSIKEAKNIKDVANIVLDIDKNYIPSLSSEIIYAFYNLKNTSMLYELPTNKLFDKLFFNVKYINELKNKRCYYDILEAYCNSCSDTKYLHKLDTEYNHFYTVLFLFMKSKENILDICNIDLFDEDEICIRKFFIELDNIYEVLPLNIKNKLVQEIDLKQDFLNKLNVPTSTFSMFYSSDEFKFNAFLDLYIYTTRIDTFINAFNKMVDAHSNKIIAQNSEEDSNAFVGNLILTTMTSLKNAKTPIESDSIVDTQICDCLKNFDLSGESLLYIIIVLKKIPGLMAVRYPEDPRLNEYEVYIQYFIKKYNLLTAFNNKTRAIIPEPIDQDYISEFAINIVNESKHDDDYNDEETDEDENDNSNKEKKELTKTTKDFRNYKKNPTRYDKNASDIILKAKNILTGATRARTNIIEGENWSIIRSLIRLCGGVLLWSYSKFAFALIILTRICMHHSITNKQRKSIIMELEAEKEIIEEKIKDVENDGEREAKYALMRDKSNIEKAISNIGKGIKLNNVESEVVKRTLNERGVKSKV